MIKKVQVARDGFDIEFPGGGAGSINISEIHTVDLETMPTMSVDVDYVTLGYENGEFIEVPDDAEGFMEFCNELSTKLLIHPPIHHRFPVSAETGIDRVYERS